jgi:hypothetical protein
VYARLDAEEGYEGSVLRFGYDEEGAAAHGLRVGDGGVVGHAFCIAGHYAITREATNHPVASMLCGI